MLINEIVPRSPSGNPASKPALTGGESIPQPPWSWVPTVYVAEGLPYAMVATVSVILYKQLGISNAKIAFYTSWLYLPWVIKPFWSPVIELLRTRRLWIWTMQCVLGAALASIALTLPTARFFQFSIALFWLVAFSSATHDIAADGFYLLALSERQQSFFVGIRNTAFRVAMVCAQGGLVILAGTVGDRTGDRVTGWMAAFGAAGILLIGLGVYHGWILPRPPTDRAAEPGTLGRFFTDFLATFRVFFQKPKLGVALLFLLFYRFGEAQMLKMVSPFMLDARGAGGLGLTADEVGLVYGTIGVTALLLGGITGGMLVSRHGLRAWLWPMVFFMHVPDAVFVYLARAQPHSLGVIGAGVALEQFGYGFGFTAYMLYMIYIARGEHATAHYSICTGFMALGLMLPGMWAGRLQEGLGYPRFFTWTLAATLAGFVVTALIPLDPEFGRKSAGPIPSSQTAPKTR